ncbi:hypothetical protein ABKN59_001662 [Abortiporus biennis]
MYRFRSAAKSSTRIGRNNRERFYISTRRGVSTEACPDSFTVTISGPMRLLYQLEENKISGLKMSTKRVYFTPLPFPIIENIINCRHSAGLCSLHFLFILVPVTNLVSARFSFARRQFLNSRILFQRPSTRLSSITMRSNVLFFFALSATVYLVPFVSALPHGNNLVLRNDGFDSTLVERSESLIARGNKPSGYEELRGTQYEETPEQKRRREKFEQKEREEQKKKEKKEKKEAKKQGKREFDEFQLLARDDFSDDLLARELESLEARGNKPSGYEELRGTQYEETPEQKKRREKFEQKEREEQKKKEKKDKKEAKKQGKRDFDDLYARDDLFSDLFARDDDLYARDFEFLEARGNKPSSGGYAELRGTQYPETPEEKKRREKFEKMERKEQKKQEKEAKKQGKREFDDLYIRDDSFGDLFARDDVYWY